MKERLIKNEHCKNNKKGKREKFRRPHLRRRRRTNHTLDELLLCARCGALARARRRELGTRSPQSACAATRSMKVRPLITMSITDSFRGTSSPLFAHSCFASFSFVPLFIPCRAPTAHSRSNSSVTCSGSPSLFSCSAKISCVVWTARGRSLL